MYFSSRGLFENEEMKELKMMYSKLYAESDVDVCLSFKKYNTLNVNGKQLGGYKTRSSSSSIVLITCNSALINSRDMVPSVTSEQRPVQIRYFASHSIKLRINLCHMSLLQSRGLRNIHDRMCMENLLTVWEHEIYETDFCTLIPIQFIKCRTISLVDTVGICRALILCPCVNF